MKTITFYSYKGGVGRTLLLANVAKYLSRFGQKVFALDFDLEAPGLHYKLNYSDGQPIQPIKEGIVDYIYSYTMMGKMAELQDCVIQTKSATDEEGSIYMMSAGRAPTAQYWERLSQINWHDLFYSEGAKGVPFFLDLKARIEEEYAPDYLLIDSRTGITEMGGVATTLLPEFVVCLMLNNRENLEGAREVLRSINRTVRLRNQEPINITPVVTRLPVWEDSAEEYNIIKTIQQFMNENAQKLEDTLSVSEIPILHTERTLEFEETILVDDEKTTTQPLLLRDYLRLFAKIIPSNILEDYIFPLVNDAQKKAWDNPEEAKKDLIALTEICSHPEPFRTLMKLHRLQKSDSNKIMELAYQYWRATGVSNDILQLEAIREAIKDKKKYTISRVWNNEYFYFIEAVWSTLATDDAEIGICVLQECRRTGNKDRIFNIIEKIINTVTLSEPLLKECMIGLGVSGYVRKALKLIDDYRALLHDNDSLYYWVRLIVHQKDASRASEFWGAYPIFLDYLRDYNVDTYIRLAIFAQREVEARATIQNCDLTKMINKTTESTEALETLGAFLFQHGYSVEYEAKIRLDLPDKAELIINKIKDTM